MNVQKSQVKLQTKKTKNKTRLHSSRMRTGRSLTVCRGGGVPPSGRGCPRLGGLLPRGVPPSWGVSFPRGCLFLGGLPPRGGGFLSQGDASFQGGLLPGGCPLQGISLWGVPIFRGSPSQGGASLWGGLTTCTEADPPCEQNYTHV